MVAGCGGVAAADGAGRVRAVRVELSRVGVAGRFHAVVPAKDFKKRMVVEIDGAPHMIEHINVQTPSARGAATLYKIKARNLKTRTRVEKSYRGTDALAESSFERRPVQYLYRDT